MPICTRCGSRNVEGARFCGNCGAPASALAIPSPPVSANPTCKICDRGTLMRRKIRRLSGPAVAIGYILLIPSILGMVGCAILLAVSLLAGVAGAAHGSAFATAFAGIGAIAFVYIGILSFVFGLVGWLLIMKKHILQCVYCGAVVDAAAAVYSPPPRNTVSARNVILGVVCILGITGAIWAFIVAEAGTQTSTPTATTAKQVQPTPDNSTAEPTRSDAWQSFTSADARFSVLFPSTPQQSLQTIHLESGETTMAYRFASADNGTSYFVTYADYRPDVVGPSPQVFLQGNENFAVNGKRLLTDAAINLDGVPGRAFTFTGSYADGSSRSCNVHAFLAGTRLYTLTVLSPPIPLKGDTATQADLFMNSFRILDMPDQVGQCRITSVKKIDTRLEGTPGSGSAIEFTNGGYQVSYDTVPAIEKSLPGDQVKFCLVSIPANCPAGDARGREYKTENLRTGESWTLPDSEHECGGA